MKFKRESIILVAILLFATFLRLYSLGNAPLWVDESISSITALKITQTGLPFFDSGMLNARAYIFHYLQSFFLLFGQTDFLARIISVIFGVLTVFLTYKVGKEYSDSGGIISALFMAVFYLEVFYSRQARMYQMFQFFFFLTIYLLYKSKEKPKYLYFTIISFLITLDTQIQGLILAPFIIAHILMYNRKKWGFTVIPALTLLWKALPTASLSAGSGEVAINYASRYASYTTNMVYLLVLFVPGVVWSYLKNKRLTILIVGSSVITLIGVFSLQTFALRYSYFFVFPLVLYSGLLMAYLYDKYGKLIIIPILIILIIPSNLFYPNTYTNVLNPINYNINDASAPYTDYKAVPQEVISELKSNTTLISYFALDLEWYVRKPDYALPFSMNGIGLDQISHNRTDGVVVDRYSGAKILMEVPLRPYNLVADSFSVSKLKWGEQTSFLARLITNCTTIYSASDLKIYNCQ